MPIYGDLATMSLADVLQWVGVNQKTGILEVERDGINRRIEFRKGFIGACSTDEPSSQLGAYLKARGLVTDEQVDAALARQKIGNERLGWLLVDMGVMTETDVARMVAANIEEMVQALFEWDEAVFRFYEGATFDPVQIELSLPVNDVLMRGIQYKDEVGRIRETFNSSGVVLRRKECPAPAQLVNRGMSARIYESIDGERTLGEILALAQSSEHLVLKLLFQLFRMDLVEIVAEREVVPGQRTLIDRREVGTIRAVPSLATPRGGALPVDDEASEQADLSIEVEASRRLMDRGEFEPALELLNATFRANPGNFEVGELLARAEAGFVENAGGLALSSTSVPVARARTTGEAPDPVGAEESFLLSLIDGQFDVQSILSLATLREADVLKTLEQMLDKGMIELQQVAADHSKSVGNRSPKG